MELVIIGLGKIGGNLAKQTVEKEITVYGKARSPKPELEKLGIQIFLDYNSLFKKLQKPCVVYLSLPAGEVVDKVISEITPFLDEGDVILDGGNSFYQDSIRREEELAQKGIYFCDTGTSGGWEGARYGACFMVGGRREGVKIAIENVPEPYLGLMKNVEDFHRFYEDLDDDIGIVLDVAHANLNHQIQEFLKHFPEKIVHMHVSDNDGANDVHLGIGYGSIDWESVANLVKEADYGNLIMLESTEHVAESLEVLRKLFV